MTSQLERITNKEPSQLWRGLKSAGKYALIATAIGCAGMQRGCSSCNASSFGADWIAVQYNATGEPINCWQLPNTSVDNESQSDGIYWLDKNTGNLVHISGWYNRVQVNDRRWEEAAKSLGVDLNRCKDGKYLKAEQ